jgi:hypothetical protein
MARCRVLEGEERFAREIAIVTKVIPKLGS